MADPAEAAFTSRKAFVAKFHRAVLVKDVDWILANMSPSGWQLGDAYLSAETYAAEFRRGNLDYGRVLDGEAMRQRLPDSAGRLAYREWFMRCPDAYANENWDDPRPDPGSAYLIHWEGQGCPAAGPVIRIQQSGARIYIRSLAE